MAVEDEECMEVEEKKKVTLSLLLRRSIHHTKEDQDASCPHIQWMGEDLVHCPGVGEWKCMLQDYQYGDLLYGGGSENTDYRSCNHPDHNRCSVYLNHQKPTTSPQKGQLEFQFS